MTKRTEITIEIDELIVFSKSRTDTTRPSCPVCGERAMVTPEEAATLTRVTVRSIYARVEDESLHFLETPDGLLLLCANSLGQRVQTDAEETHLRDKSWRGNSHGEGLISDNSGDA